METIAATAISGGAGMIDGFARVARARTGFGFAAVKARPLRGRSRLWLGSAAAGALLAGCGLATGAKAQQVVSFQATAENGQGVYDDLVTVYSYTTAGPNGVVYVNPNYGGATILLNATEESVSFSTPTTTTIQATATDTELVGKLNGATLFDQTYASAFNTPTVQAGVQTAEAAITKAGGPGVVIGAPTLVSQNVSTSSTTSTLYSYTGNAAVALTYSTIYGPAPVAAIAAWAYLNFPSPYVWDPYAGLVSVCALPAAPTSVKPTCAATNATPLFVLSGQTATVITSAATYTIDTAVTTTDTTTTTDVYDINATGGVQTIGTVHADVVAAGFDQADRFSGRLLQAGTDDSAANAAPAAAAPLGYAEPLLADVVGKSLAKPVEAPSPWHAWAETYGYYVREGSSASFPGDTREALGINGGLGYDLTNNFRLGAAFDVGETRIDADAVGERATVDLSQVGLYGAWRSGPFYASAAGTLGWGSASTTVAPTGLGVTDSASNALAVDSVSAETGYHIALQGFTLTPSLGAAWFHVDSGAFTESGGAFALTGPSASYDRAKGWLGLDIAKSFDLAGGSTLGLEAYAKAVAIGGTRRIAVPVSFVGSATPLAIDGANPGALGADLGAKLSWRLTASASLYAAYEARLRQGYTAQTGMAGIRIAF